MGENIEDHDMSNSLRVRHESYENTREENAFSAIRDALSKANRPFVVFTGDMVSLVLLHMVRSIAGNSVPVLHIDTTAYFREVYLYIEKMQRLWGFHLFRERNEEALLSINMGKDRDRCCRSLKADTIRRAIEKYQMDCLFTGAANDEWGPGTSRLLLSSVNGCLCLNPVAYLSYTDLWDYVTYHNLPYCSLYNRGYRKIDCLPCTGTPVDQSKQKQDEKEIAETLKTLGYM